MRKACRILLLAVVLSAGVSCKSPVKETEGKPSEVAALLADADRLLASKGVWCFSSRWGKTVGSRM